MNVEYSSQNITSHIYTLYKNTVCLNFLKVNFGYITNLLVATVALKTVLFIYIYPMSSILVNALCFLHESLGWLGKGRK
jgi:hypothetical protein